MRVKVKILSGPESGTIKPMRYVDARPLQAAGIIEILGPAPRPNAGTPEWLKERLELSRAAAQNNPQPSVPFTYALRKRALTFQVPGEHSWFIVKTNNVLGSVEYLREPDADCPENIKAEWAKVSGEKFPTEYQLEAQGETALQERVRQQGADKKPLPDVSAAAQLQKRW